MMTTAATREVGQALAQVCLYLYGLALAGATRVVGWYLVLAAAYRLHVLKRFVSEFCIYKVIAIDEDDHDALPVNITRRFLRDWKRAERAGEENAWEPGALEASGITGNIRVEVRYVQHERKYRKVLRPGDRVGLPQGFGLLTGRGKTFAYETAPPRLVNAELMRRDGALPVDVTERVLKYAGPAGDFHGTRVALVDMFPGGLPPEIHETFKELSVYVPVMPAGAFVEIPVDCEDVAAALRP